MGQLNQVRRKPRGRKSSVRVSACAECISSVRVHGGAWVPGVVCVVDCKEVWCSVCGG